jgi:gluconate 2-dehydrogenase gamma chain
VEDLLAAGEAAAAAGREQPRTFRNLTPEQAADVEAFTAQIIPTDATPGAREAHVVHFIDIAIGSFFADRREPLMAALRDLESRVTKAHGARARFATLTDAQQKAIVGATASDEARVFRLLRALTLNGMFASPEHGGNRGKVGWQLIGFQDRYSWAAPFGAYDR